MGGDPGNAQEQHHVDGTGGLRQPGTLAVDSQGNVLVPTLGVGSSLHGEVVKFAGTSLPSSAAQCPGPSNMPINSPQPTVFIDSTANNQGSPQGIAHDPTCVGHTGCWAVSSVLQGNAVSWYNDDGNADVARPSVGPGGVPQAEAQTGPGGYSPQGLAFTPDGTLYIADIHISCVSSGGGEPASGGCGPVTNQGQILKFTFGPGSTPSAPVKVNTEADNFPVSVTACTPTATTVCPTPAGR
jgi:hypothetical protein